MLQNLRYLKDKHLTVLQMEIIYVVAVLFTLIELTVAAFKVEQIDVVSVIVLTVIIAFAMIFPPLLGHVLNLGIVKMRKSLGLRIVNIFRFDIVFIIHIIAWQLFTICLVFVILSRS